jgi:hypothetical protein
MYDRSVVNRGNKLAGMQEDGEMALRYYHGLTRRCKLEG